MPRDQVIEGDLITVTETTAIAAAQTMGFGDHRQSNRVAGEAMRRTLDDIEISGQVMIGQGARGKTKSLQVGKQVGALKSAQHPPAFDIAVSPLEGVDLCATGAPGAVSVLATAERGGLLHAPDAYMEKIIVGPTAKGTVHLDAPVPENLRNIAAAFRREVTDLTVVVLDRGRHQRLIGDIREAGARIRLIPHGDLAAGIAVAIRGTSVHAVMGTGGSSEGVIAAAALRCLGGEIQARLCAEDEEQASQLSDLGFTDLGKIYTTEDLARGKHIAFSCTGVTDGELLRGVRFFGGGIRTSTLFMSLESRVIRFVDAVRREEASSPIRLR